MNESFPSHMVKQFEKNHLRSQCDKNYDINNGNRDFCILGDARDKHPEFAVFGDSHADAMLPAFDKALTELQRSFVHIGLGGCPPITGVYVLKSNFEIGICENLVKRQLDYVKKNHIKKVFLVARWSLYTDGDHAGDGMYYLGLGRNDKRDKNISRQAFAHGVYLTVRAYRELGVEVFVVSQIPVQLHNVEKVYNRAYVFDNKIETEAVIRKFSVPIEKHRQLKSFAEGVFGNEVRRDQIELINFDDILCVGDICALGKSNQPYYYDTAHLSVGGAYMLADRLKVYIH